VSVRDCETERLKLLRDEHVGREREWERERKAGASYLRIVSIESRNRSTRLRRGKEEEEEAV
jgi:hypothetical protein